MLLLRTSGKRWNSSTTIHPAMLEASKAAPPLFILGAGSIGLLLAASIRASVPNYPVRLLLRSTSSLLNEEAKLRSKGTVTLSLQQSFLKSADGKRRPILVPIPYQVISSSNEKHHQMLSCVLLTTKAHQARAAMASIQHCIDRDTTIIILCNGALAVAEELKDLHCCGTIFTAFTTHGAYREATEGLTHLVHAGYGEIVLPQCPTLVRLLNDCGLNARSVDSSQNEAEMEWLLWQKLAANAVVNPLTALYQCPNGALYKTVPQFATHYLPGIVQEVAQVYRAVTGWSHDEGSVENAWFESVVQVIANTSQNRSSSYQDVLLGRVPEEIHYLTGYILRHAAAHGIACPIQTNLYQRIFPSNNSA